MSSNRRTRTRRINTFNHKKHHQVSAQVDSESVDDVAAISPLPKLSKMQGLLLDEVRRGLGIYAITMSTDGRETYTLGTWMFSSGVIMTACMLSPTVASTTLHAKPDIVPVMETYASYVLSKSTISGQCKHVSDRGRDQFMGRWVTEVCDAVESDGYHEFDTNELDFCNLSGSKLAIYITTAKDEKYVCLLSTESLRVLSQYAPVGYCYGIKSGRSAGRCIYRADSGLGTTYLLLTPNTSSVQYNGSPSRIAELYYALSESLHIMVREGVASSFMSTLIVTKSIQD